MREPTAEQRVRGSANAGPAHQQGLRCTSWKGSAEPLLHQKVTFLSGGNRDFSTLQKQIFCAVDSIWKCEF